MISNRLWFKKDNIIKFQYLINKKLNCYGCEYVVAIRLHHDPYKFPYLPAALMHRVKTLSHQIYYDQIIISDELSLLDLKPWAIIKSGQASECYSYSVLKLNYATICFC